MVIAATAASFSSQRTTTRVIERAGSLQSRSQPQHPSFHEADTGEIAARRTTDLLLKAHDESVRRLRDRRRDDDGGGRPGQTTTTAVQDDDGVVVRWDAAAILAAGQALEFWAHRAEYRGDDRRRDRRGGRDGWDHRRGRRREPKRRQIFVDN